MASPDIARVGNVSMDPALDPRISKNLARFTVFCCALSMGFGSLVLMGWIFHIPRLKSFLPGYVQVKANTAVCFLLIGLALSIARSRGHKGSERRNIVIGLLALVVSAVGLLSFLEYWYGWNLGLDQLLILADADDTPGSVRIGLMSPITGLGFALLGPAVVALDCNAKWARWLGQALTSVVAITSLFGILDLALEPGASAIHTYIAPTTALVLFILAFGVMTARTDCGLGALLATLSLGGMLARRLFPAAIMFPFVIGWMRSKGLHAGLYSDWTGMAIVTVSATALLAGTTAWTAFLIDRTDAKRRKAEESSRRLAAIVTGSNDAIIGKSLDGMIETWNPGAEEMYGYSAAEVVGHHISLLMPPDHLDDYSKIMERITRGEIVRHYETVRMRKDGRVFPVSLSVSPVRDESGKIASTSAIARDITGHKQAEESLRAQSHTLQLLLDNMEEGMVAADENGEFLLWNQAAEGLAGRGPADLSIEEWSLHYEMYATDGVTLLPTGQLPLVRAIRGETVRMESIVRSPKAPSGAWLEFTGRPLKDELGASRGGLVVFRDVTARKAAEREIRTLYDELEQRVHDRTAQLEAANKELEAFTYSVSHDLRAPLRHISGFSRILSEEFGPALPPEAQHHLQRIEDGTRRMGQLVDDLLNLARVGRRELSLQITGLKSVVEEVINALALEIAGREIEWKIGSLPYVECDPGLMNQVFQNLISNALKFTRPRKPAVIEIGQQQENGAVVVFVRDNGVGFSMKYAEKLFGVFQRLHRVEEFEGTGVGLATVQRVIQKHGGRIWAEAELDKGATFYFTLANLAKNESKAEAAAGGTL